MSWVAVAIGTVAVAGAAYSADQQRKAAHGQMDAAKKAAEEDARKRAEAETSALLSANTKVAETKRRRRASSLGMPNDSALSLGAGPVQQQPMSNKLGGG